MINKGLPLLQALGLPRAGAPVVRAQRRRDARGQHNAYVYIYIYIYIYIHIHTYIYRERERYIQ